MKVQSVGFGKTMKFLRDVRTEGRKVTWPDLKQTRTMTIMVFILVTLVGLFLLLVDFLIGSGLNFLLNL